ncbi:hypothetical protein KUTeg_007092 [Tegillarca granosa]|uniref:RING-type domain-containing protein n=1 Tax=Tegillarca granosa TaxID=220873 RepID=A0ABQ9FEK7_TEGGR|nr:hypothetical protein KUTeg_007092 [Tegillarca granosa]
MGQKIVKKEVEKGLKYYSEQQMEEAINEWLNALKRINKTNPDAEKFNLLGLLCTAYYDVGKYREVLLYSDQQFDIATVLNDSLMKAEANFNLARGNERLSEFNKTLLYGKRCLEYKKTTDIHKYVYLCLGNAYIGISDFPNAFKCFENAVGHDENNGVCEKQVEIIACVGLAHIYTLFKDYETATSHCERALDLVRTGDENINLLKYERWVQVELSIDAMKTAMKYTDRYIQARCLLTFAEIHRKRNDFERSYPRYESAFSIYNDIGDRMGQIEVLSGMSKAMIGIRDYSQALELNERALALSQKIGSKMNMLQCRRRMAELNMFIDKSEVAQVHNGIVQALINDLNLYCGICSEMLGEKPEQLDTIPCGHLIHTRCVPHLARYTWGRKGRKRPCPTCRRNSSCNPMFH